MSDRFERALAAIDARNADDPHTIVVNGAVRPKEQAHAEMVFDQVQRLRPDASEELLLAARAHHVRRWSIPRESYGPGRVPYLKWRTDLKRVHAEELSAAMAAAGYGPESIARASEIVRRVDLRHDADCRALEDAICLVFLQTQLAEVAAKLDKTKIVDILRKTMRKMSEEGIAAALRLQLTEEGRALLAEASQ